MKTITIATKLTPKMVETIDSLVKEGIYSSRSEALRDAVRQQIKSYKGIILGQKLNTKSGTTRLTKKEKDQLLKEFAEETGLKI